MSGGSPAGLEIDYLVEHLSAAEIQSALADFDRFTGLGAAQHNYGLTGEGQTVVVIDTGIAYSHESLGAGFGSNYRVVGGYDFANGDRDPYDDGPTGSHGTHVAGIIASADADNPGVAPGVDLVALKVFDAAGNGQFDWIEQALTWVHQHRNSFQHPITTVNLSLGCDYNGSQPPAWSTIEDELAQLQADGIFIAVAAGNSFDAYGTPGLSYPASSPYVVPVSSVDPSGELSYYSQRHPRAIAAPGRGILSSVPDYAGDMNGRDDDFARYSGTSMAAPFVAGASVLLRQAYEFVGVAATQNMLYSVMRNTADVIRDAATGIDVYRLNIARALDSIIPADDFASAPETAWRLETVTDTISVSGAISRRDDRDYFTFTAGTSGRVSLSAGTTHWLEPDWHLVGWNGSEVDGRLSFDVVAGQSYTFGMGTSAGLGRYTIDVQVIPTSVAGDGVTQQHLQGERITTAGQWYSFTAGRDGFFTAEAFFRHTAGDVDIEVLDAARRVLAGSYSTSDSERVDVEVRRGETIYVHAFVSGLATNGDVDLRITNLVGRAGDQVQVAGTAADDVFTATADFAAHQLTVNGVTYTFDSHAVRGIWFDGQAGSDTALLIGTRDSDSAVLRVGSADLTGSGYLLAAAAEQITVRSGGGVDKASFYDSPGDDRFQAGPRTALLAGPGFLNRAQGFRNVYAYATAGGRDTAQLNDSVANDKLAASPTWAKLWGVGYAIRVEQFDAVHALATGGGRDTARLYDSAGDDVLTRTANFVLLSGSGFANRAKGFENVRAFSQGGEDRAFLNDSLLDDHFQAAGNFARVTNRRTDLLIHGFAYLQAETSRQNDRLDLQAVDFVLETLQV